MKTEPTTVEIYLNGGRLCVYASGSVTIVICCFLRSIKVSCLHLGQNSGKCSRIVSILVLTLVLLPQFGQETHLSFVFLSLMVILLALLVLISALNIYLLNVLYMSGLLNASIYGINLSIDFLPLIVCQTSTTKRNFICEIAGVSTH